MKDKSVNGLVFYTLQHVLTFFMTQVAFFT